MLKLRLAVASLGFAIILSASVSMFAQAANLAPAAPLPSQILSAKKVFISNAGGGFDSKTWSGGPTQPYNEFYAAIRSWGRFELVSAPSDADLVLQISFVDPITEVNGSKESGCSSSNTPQINLLLLDPKTRIVLWPLNENASVKHLQKGRDKSLEDAIVKIVSDLKALTTASTSASK